ncbi:PepSY domain-containing protein [Williamsia soli]|uniref:PepSY domain-containing protein n=1 Tax=Williamsia soli TaxID=364929 RepID=UPI001A9F4F8E|nr:PepSY domain-containing protein [Williamsia soli]
MPKKTIVIAGVATAAVLALGGTGIAYAVTDGFAGSDDLGGNDLDRATTAAIAEVGGGSVTSADKDDDGITTYDLDVIGSDGVEYEITLDEGFKVLKVDRDDDDAEPTNGDQTAPAAAPTSAPPVAAPVDPDDLVGEELQRASDAAIAAAGGGTVTDAERSDDPGHAFDVEVRLADGSEVDVDLNADFGVLTIDTDR